MLSSLYLSSAVGLTLGLIPVQGLTARIVARFAPSTRLSAADLGFAASFLLGASAPILARLIHDTSVCVATATVAFLVGYVFQPLRPPLSSRPHRSLPSVAGLVAAATPRFFALGAAAWFVLFLASRRRVAPATLLAGLASPVLAGAAYQSDLATVLGGLVAIVLTFDYADQFPVLVGLATRRERPSSYTWRTNAMRYGAAFAVALILALFFFNRYVYRGFSLGVYLFREGNPHLPFIALTFDDGPDPSVTPAVLDILRERGIKATFFMVGSHVEAHPEIARRITEEDHEVGNHTYNHRNLLPLSVAATDLEFLKAQEVIEAVTGVKPRLFRPPRGLYSKRVLELAREHRVTIALWTRSSRDWLELKPEEMVRGLVGTVRGGDVLLFHDGGNLITSTGGWRHNVVEGLPVVIDELTGRGFRFVTVSELMIIAGLTGSGDGLEGGGGD